MIRRSAKHRHRVRGLVGRLSAALALPVACVSAPASNTAVPAGTRTLTFTGKYPHQEGTRITVHAEVRRAGSWETIGPSVEVPTEGSFTIADVPVPDDAWTGHCETAVFRVRTGEGSVALLGRDRACIDAAGPAITLGEVLGCFTPRLVVFRHSPGETFTGDVSVTSQDQADGYACVSTIDGNLTLTGESRLTDTSPDGPIYAPGLRLGMPNLTSVTGLAAIDGGRTETIQFSQLSRVGTADRPETGLRFTQYVFHSGARGESAFTHLETPRLTRTLGTLQVEAVNPERVRTSSRITHPIGFDSVTSAENVVLHKANPATSYLSGLAGLTEVTRDLSIQYDAWELSGNVARAVTRVGRDLTVRAGNEIYNFMPALTTVGRSLTIANVAGGFCRVTPTTALVALSSIGGDLTVSGVGLPGCASTLPALTTLGGSLRITDNSDSRRPLFGATGTSHLTLGGLVLDGTLLDGVPLRADASLAMRGTVQITGNTNLCECHAQAFIEGLTGFTGSATHSGNRVCTPCPAPVACP